MSPGSLFVAGAALVVGAVAWACGPLDPPAGRDTRSGELGSMDASARTAVLRIDAALDTRGLASIRPSEKLIIHRLSVRVADVRLLSADPRVPVGGLDLVGDPITINARPGALGASPWVHDRHEGSVLAPHVGSSDLARDQEGTLHELAFTGGLDEEDLAAYVRIAPGDEPQGFSVVVEGEFRTEREGRWVSVPFVLRSRDSADLVTSLSLPSDGPASHITIGVPARRLINDATCDALRRQVERQGETVVSTDRVFDVVRSSPLRVDLVPGVDIEPSSARDPSSAREPNAVTPPTEMDALAATPGGAATGDAARAHIAVQIDRNAGGYFLTGPGAW